MNNDRLIFASEIEARRIARMHWKVASAVVAGAMLTAIAFAVVGGGGDGTKNAFEGCSRPAAGGGAQTSVVGPDDQRARPGQVYLCRETSLMASMR